MKGTKKTLALDRIMKGDTLAELKKFPEGSVDMVITSPPYWALRDYGVKGQLGLEKTFEEYISKLCNIFDEVRRVLKQTGTCWVNLGDTYSGGGNTNDRFQKQNISKSVGEYKFNFKLNQIQEKCLCQIPFRFAIEMTIRGWILRNTIIWWKPNCIPSSVKDRFTVDFEYVFFFVKNKKYWFETQYEPLQESSLSRARYGSYSLKTDKGIHGGMNLKNQLKVFEKINKGELRGRNKRCVWRIPTRPFKGSHFAVFPETLVETPIKAGCPEFVCNKCGKAREKIIENGKLVLESHKRKAIGKFTDIKTNEGGKMFYRDKNPLVPNAHYKKIDKGYTDCGCNAGFKGGIVLDPFMGSGTTAVVAKKLGRSYMGIELNPKYIEMAEKRIKAVPKITRMA